MVRQVIGCVSVEESAKDRAEETRNASLVFRCAYLEGQRRLVMGANEWFAPWIVGFW